MFKAMRMQNETCGGEPDFKIGSLSDLPALAADWQVTREYLPENHIDGSIDPFAT